MFNIFKKKDSIKSDLVSIVDGISFPVTEVKDEVFSSKAMGDGIAFTAEGNKIVSPCSGVLTAVLPHAYGITREDGIEVMIHIGIDTVTLNGKGFDVKVKQGGHIKKGETLVILDLDYLKQTGLDLSIMLIILNDKGKIIKFQEYGKVIQGETVVLDV